MTSGLRDSKITPCLYCGAAGPFTTIDHVVPESLGNDELILEGCVCDRCQAYFGKEVEQYVLAKTPIAVWRTLLGIRTKKGRLPTVDVTQPTRIRGTLPDVHSGHDNLGFTAHPDGSTSVDIDDDSIVGALFNGDKRQFNLVLSPKKLSMLGRFLGKVGLGVIAVSERQRAYEPRFDRIRRYSRFGSSEEIWPIFHFTEGKMGQWKKPTLFGPTGEVLLEEVDCYSYAIIDVQKLYTLFRFSMGLDSWVIALDDPFPSAAIRSTFPDRKINLLWYPSKQWRYDERLEIGTSSNLAS